MLWLARYETNCKFRLSVFRRTVSFFHQIWILFFLFDTEDKFALVEQERCSQEVFQTSQVAKRTKFQVSTASGGHFADAGSRSTFSPTSHSGLLCGSLRSVS